MTDQVAAPNRPKAPLRHVSSEITGPTDKGIWMRHMFDDAAGHRWSSAQTPVFLFDLEYEGTSS